jgi:hypothetical protein
MRSSAILSAGLALLLLASCGGGEPDILVEKAWARETRAGQGQAAVYLRIVNTGTADDRLLTAAARRASSATLHGTSDDGGIHRMRELDGLEIPAGSAADFAPGGRHIMLSGVTEPLQPGTSFPLILRFERSGERQVQVDVQRAGETMKMENRP